MCLYTKYIFHCSHEATKPFKTSPCTNQPDGRHVREIRRIILRKSCYKCRMGRETNRRATREVGPKASRERREKLESLKAKLEQVSAEQGRKQEEILRQIKYEVDEIKKEEASVASADSPVLIRRGAIGNAADGVSFLEMTPRHEYNANEMVWHAESIKFKNMGFQNLNPWRKASLRRRNHGLKPEDDELLSPKSLPKTAT